MDRARLTPFAIRVIRGLRLAIHLLWMALGSALLYPLLSQRRCEQLRQRWSQQLLRILAVRLVSETTETPRGCLVLANHVSWLDIFVINAFRPVAFIAKSEVRRWPLIGWLAARNDTIFLRRGSRAHARVVNSEIDALLDAGQDVAIFPEGTTTDGTHLLGFHAALLQPAIETGCPVLPLAIAYCDAAGRLTTAPSFSGETSLWACLCAILACPELIVRLVPLPAINASGMLRRELSLQAHAVIASCLLTRSGFRLPHNPPGTEPGLQGV